MGAEKKEEILSIAKDRNEMVHMMSMEIGIVEVVRRENGKDGKPTAIVCGLGDSQGYLFWGTENGELVKRATSSISKPGPQTKLG